MHPKLFSSRAFIRLQAYTSEQWLLIKADARIQALCFMREADKADSETIDTFYRLLETLVRSHVIM